MVPWPLHTFRDTRTLIHTHTCSHMRVSIQKQLPQLYPKFIDEIISTRALCVLFPSSLDDGRSKQMVLKKNNNYQFKKK